MILLHQENVRKLQYERKFGSSSNLRKEKVFENSLDKSMNTYNKLSNILIYKTLNIHKFKYLEIKHFPDL